MQPTKAKNLPKDELSQSIVEYIFKEARAELPRLTNLGIYLDTLGIFFYGRSRLNEFIKRIEEVQQNRREKKEKRFTYVESLSDEELVAKKKRIEELLIKYDKYVAEKKVIRQSNKAFKSNLEEYQEVSSRVEEIPTFKSIWDEIDTRDEPAT